MKTAIIIGATLGIVAIYAQRKMYRLANDTMDAYINL